MAYIIPQDYPKFCAEGATPKLACESLGGAYWDWNGQGQFVCSVLGTTVNATAWETVPSCPVLGEEVIEPLSFSNANILLGSVLAVWGLAYVVRLMLRSIYNR